MSISFKQYLVEEEKIVFFSFGRMNPPTIGHGKLLDAMAKAAGKNPYRMYLSQSAEPKKNPLSYKDKIKTVRKMFPRHARNVLLAAKIKNIFQVVQQLYDDGFRKIIMVVGSDRIREFDALINKYNGKKGAHGFYNFSDIKVISAGDRDPDAEGASGMSASKMRAAASSNDFTAFSQGLPKQFSNAEAKKLFNNVRKGMGLKEAVEFHKHIQLASVSETREAFIDGNLFNVGDEVAIKESGQLGIVTRLGSNYVIIESDNKQYRKWLEAVEKIEEACWDSHKQVGTKKGKDGKQVPNCVPKEEYKDPAVLGDYGTPKSVKKMKAITPGQSENKNYFKGLKKGTSDKRAAHFNKNAKKSDNDASAYKPAPGDATGKTKPSKYTKSFKAMFDENDAVDMAKTRIDKEKTRDDRKHDRMLDRARLRDTFKKNRNTKG
jgi:hypothetical protein|tara:strand:+ start:3800 stop:5101 length:1302 start_codon:yes stop_codon:yes gene_type:complete